MNFAPLDCISGPYCTGKNYKTTTVKYGIFLKSNTGLETRSYLQQVIHVMRHLKPHKNTKTRSMHVFIF